jgi:uncharacterized protein
MNAAFVSTVGEFRQQINNNQLPSLISAIQSGFIELYQHQPSAEEITAWERSLPAFIATLSTECDSLPILIELRMPIGNERADMVLLGGLNHALVVELKHWKGTIESYVASPNFVTLGGASGLLRPHPAYQADGYVGKLRNYHGIGKDYEIKGLVFLHETEGAKEIRQLMGGYSSQVFFKGDVEQIGAFTSAHLLPNSRTSADAYKFANAQYTVSARLVDFVRNNRAEIKARVYSELAASGFSLCEEQMLAVAKIIAAAQSASESKLKNENPHKKAFVVNGTPGSGKTLVALTLLIESLGLGVKALYGLRRNGALVNTLRRALGADLDSSVYFLNIPRTNSGVLDSGFGGADLDLLICDEAQRMLKNSLRIAHDRASVVVYLVDETQRLNIDEQGIEQNFREGAQAAGVEFEKLPSLPAGVRCRGGIPYHNFVEQLLASPSQLANGFLKPAPWGDSYRFRAFDDYEQFQQALVQLRDKFNMKVALVASWTESDGDSKWRINMRPKTSPNNVRVGPNLQSGNFLYAPDIPNVSWVMNPDDYRTFWAGGSDLDVCASIYGSQGFETDAVGFIWGKDLVWNQAQRTWALGGGHTSRDTAGGTQQNIKNLMNQIGDNTGHSLYNDVKTLLLNRARIFLTRGILATFVYAEDEGTRAFLKTLED